MVAGQCAAHHADLLEAAEPPRYTSVGRISSYVDDPDMVADLVPVNPAR